MNKTVKTVKIILKSNFNGLKRYKGYAKMGVNEKNRGLNNKKCTYEHIFVVPAFYVTLFIKQIE